MGKKKNTCEILVKPSEYGAHTWARKPHVIHLEVNQLEHLESESPVYLLQLKIPAPHPKSTESESFQAILTCTQEWEYLIPAFAESSTWF